MIKAEEINWIKSYVDTVGPWQEVNITKFGDTYCFRYFGSYEGLIRSLR